MSAKPFFRFSSDESSLHSFFSTVEERFNHYNILISQQNDKITSLTAQMKIQTEKNQICSRLQTETNNLNGRVKLIEESVNQNNEKIKKITSDLSTLNLTINSRLSDISQAVETKIQNSSSANENQYDSLYNQLSQHTKDLVKKSIASIAKSVDEFSHKIQNITEESQNTRAQIMNFNSQINENSKNIQMVREAFLSLNTDSKKQSDLTPLATASYINKRFSAIFASIDEIKSAINELKSRPIEPDLSGVALRSDDDNLSFDLSKPPLLPKLYKFGKISQAVDYIYELVPAIQAYMNAIYSKESSVKLKEIENENDKKDHDKQFSELRYEIADIRSLMTNMATRDDINIIQRQNSRRGGLNSSSFNGNDSGSLNGPSNGGLGISSAVRCIACGRELPSSNGYNIKQSMSNTTFPDEYSSSYISLTVNPPSVNPPQNQRRMATTATNGSRKFNVGIVENPRSARSYHTPVCRKIQTPAANCKS